MHTGTFFLNSLQVSTLPSHNFIHFTEVYLIHNIVLAFGI